MRLAAASLPPAIFRRPSLLHTLSKALSPHQHAPRAASHLPPVRLSFRPNIEHPSSKTLRRPMTTAAAAAASPPRRSRSKKKERYEAPENVLRHHLDQCSKAGDLAGALRLYDAARAAATPLSLPHYNALLYLCSSPSEDPDLDRGFEIFDQMALDSVPPNEATFTSLARLAAAKRDPDLAFGLVKRMAGSGIPPRLRSYGPALFGYCEKGDADMAREVEAHMDAAVVALEEPELVGCGGAMEPFSMRFLLIVSISFSYFQITAIARGGDWPPKHPGVVDQNGELLARHLLVESQPGISTTVTHGYMSNSELEKAVREFGQRCANISRIYRIGSSVKGFPLLVMEISDNPGKGEAEPAFKFIGNVHGDEPVGRELLILLANWLCDNYMKDPLATLIVNNVHLHILPSMNPDGFALRRRGNANNVDLNRDFPDQFFPINDIVDLRQPETRAIMRWLKEQHFTSSASLHGGALVVNYPWDGSQDSRREYFACPDDKTFRYMASVYSRSHYNMSLSNEFEGGITNGALWYPIYGGMQDWNYIHGGCFELTLEISDDKWPRANELPLLWEYNRMSMLNLVADLVKTGVHGRIYSQDGRPLPASVMIKGIKYIVNASKAFGDYHRILAPGESYEVTVSTPGFRSKTTQILVGDEAVNLDFILDPEGVDTSRWVQTHENCDCKDKIEVVEFLRGIHLGIYVLVVVLFLFLCSLFNRKAMFRIISHKGSNSGQKQLVSV